MRRQTLGPSLEPNRTAHSLLPRVTGHAVRPRRPEIPALSAANQDGRCGLARPQVRARVLSVLVREHSRSKSENGAELSPQFLPSLDTTSFTASFQWLCRSK